MKLDTDSNDLATRVGAAPRPRSMNCLTDSELIAFVDGILPSETRLHAEMHIDACSLCFSVMAGVGRTVTQEWCPPAWAMPGPLLADGQQRYIPGPEIARGGMGRILAGEDRLLGRPVALKLLRRATASLARRFLREQRITARLQHPAIVPVYDAGVLDDGEPFLVMRLVKGQSLDRIAARTASPRDRLQLLPAVLAVIDAVAYAHGEGIVHRDLKPQNVLVGPFGEVVVLDWGLARELDAGIDRDENLEDVNPADNERAMTRDGERLGTLAYMAPEQAAGHHADARADVYGLGAVLYHVLTGRPPHAERATSLSTTAVLHAPPPLALLAPDVPEDLRAIVARAMASDPAARYASAQELAADLKRWQAGRLVEAHRYSPRELLRRFLHRHRPPLLVAAAALLVLLALGSLSLWRILAERSHALAAQAIAEDARLQADTQRVAAETLVAFILDDLRPRVERLGRLDVLADVARAVLAYQDGSPAAMDTEAQLRRAQAAALAGDVAFKTGDLGAAEEAYRLSREAAGEAGTTEAATLVRSRVARGLGNIDTRRGDWALAEARFEECLALTRDATVPDLRVQHLRARLNMGELKLLNSDVAAAQTILEEGLAAANALAGAGDPHSDDFELAQAFRIQVLRVLRVQGKSDAAHETALTLVARARARLGAHPEDPRSRNTLATGLVMLAISEMLAGDLAAAERFCQESLALGRWLVDHEPTNMQWRRSLELATEWLAEILTARGEAEAALSLARSLVESRESTASSSPEDIYSRVNLAEARIFRGQMLSKLGRLDEARQEYQRTIDALEPLTESVAGGDHRSMLGAALGLLGAVEQKAHRLTVARALLQRSVDILREEWVAQDTHPSRAQLAQSLSDLAQIEQGPAARKHIAEAAALVRPLREQRLETDFKEIYLSVERIQKAIRARPPGLRADTPG